MKYYFVPYRSVIRVVNDSVDRDVLEYNYSVLVRSGCIMQHVYNIDVCVYVRIKNLTEMSFLTNRKPKKQGIFPDRDSQ